jgi:hypothetical protein
MRITSTGNLGLGVVPAAWRTTEKAIQVGTLGAISQVGTATKLSSNNYFDAANTPIYLTTAPASIYTQNSGAHQWFTAPSGTAGDAITFTQAMTLDASGNLGVGTTSAVQRLTVFDNPSSNNAADAGIAIVRSGTTYGSNLYHTYSTTTSSDAFGLTVNDNTTLTDPQYTKYLVGSNGVHVWYGSTTSTERMRIDSAGRLLVGTTSHDDGSMFQSPVTALNSYRTTTSVSAGIIGFYSDVGGTKTVRAFFRADGGLSNFSANDTNLSDERLKKDIQTAGSYLEKICAIPVRTFRYKDQFDTEDLTLGVIAQEVQQIAPELVSDEGFGVSSEDKKDYLSIYQTDMQYALMKCIQEQQAIIESLKARLDAANL